MQERATGPGRAGRLRKRGERIGRLAQHASSQLFPVAVAAGGASVASAVSRATGAGWAAAAGLGLLFGLGVYLWAVDDSKSWGDLGQGILVSVVVAIALLSVQHDADERARVDNERREQQQRNLELRRERAASRQNLQLTLTLQRNLDGVSLAGRNLSGYLLRAKTLTNADLREADLRRADLRGSDLRYADLRRANLDGADLSGVSTFHPRPGSTEPPPAYPVAGAENLPMNAVVPGVQRDELSLPGAKLAHARLSSAKLRRADLRGANFTAADLSGADLRGTRTDQTTFYGADLSGVDLRATVIAAPLLGTSLVKADLRKAVLTRDTRCSRVYELKSEDFGEGERVSRRSYCAPPALEEADVRGANLRWLQVRFNSWQGPQRIDLTGVRYDSRTTWPRHFNPQGAGARPY